jgi:hypothetical protein
MKAIFLAVLVFSSAAAIAQSADPRDCAKAIPVMKSPADDLKQAQFDATRRCETNKQRQQNALFQGARMTCNATADDRAQRESLSDAQRTEAFRACMKGHNYIVQ